jgi:hypothetical protein
VALALEKVKNSMADGVARRDVHPKHHGCLRGTFTVAESVPRRARYGIFSQPGTFHVWARASNAGLLPGAKDDRLPDARGLAIKLLNVPGQKLLPGNEDSPTMDILMVNSPAFVARDIAEYNAQSKQPGFFLTHPSLATVLLKAVSKVVEDPLMETYFSGSAYQLGPNAVKYRMVPCAGQTAQKSTSGPDHLKEALRNHLSAGDGCFEFQVQFHVNEKVTPIEDVAVAWEDGVAPFFPVARLAFVRQQFDAPAQQAFCENLSFNPWRVPQGQRPLGNLNRARKAVYQAVSQYRHQQNHAPMSEPDGDEAF